MTETAPATDEIAPFRVVIAQAALDDLQRRLDATRWPLQEIRDGVPLERMQALVEHWRTRHDWRRLEERLNTLPQFRATIDGLGIHFLHIRSPPVDALPLLMTHGCPGSVIEFLKVVDPLTNPTAHGRRAEDAFHLIIPSLPGFGFSDQPATPGWNLARIAEAWATLMRRLGHDRWVAQRGDIGAMVTHVLARRQPEGLSNAVVWQDRSADGGFAVSARARLRRAAKMVRGAVAQHVLLEPGPAGRAFCRFRTTRSVCR